MVYYDHVDTRVLILTIPSLAVLGLLVAHSFRTLPKGRALLFWCGVLGYGVLRGVALRWVIDHVPGGSFPYAIRDPLFPVFGVPLQEVTGWAIVAYLGWWLGARFSRYVFAQIAWACLFLGAISWAVESAAVAAGWWHWTVPVNLPVFANVPFIAIVDWLFVGIDFLLPFIVLTAPGLRKRPVRFLALLAFPVHFGSHCFAGGAVSGIPMHHLVHWVLIAGLVWLATRDATIDVPFADREAWLPIAGLAMVLADVVAVELFSVRRPGLVVSVAPVLAVALQALYPPAGYAASAVALVLAAWLPAAAIAVAPAATAALVSWGKRYRTWAPVVIVAALAVFALGLHSRAAKRHGDLTRRLSAAQALRDRGDLEAAKGQLTGLVSEFPGSHVPLFLLGEIDYRAERLDEARASFLRAVEIKQDDARSYRYLVVIERRLGRSESAARFAAMGRKLDPSDLELRYLSGLSVEPNDAQAALGLAALAFEVGDASGAAGALDRGMARWPEERTFYPLRVKLALRSGDVETARRVLGAWRERFPEDAEARLTGFGAQRAY